MSVDAIHMSFSAILRLVESGWMVKSEWARISTGTNMTAAATTASLARMCQYMMVRIRAWILGENWDDDQKKAAWDEIMKNQAEETKSEKEKDEKAVSQGSPHHNSNSVKGKSNNSHWNWWASLFVFMICWTLFRIALRKVRIRMHTETNVREYLSHRNNIPYTTLPLRPLSTWLSPP
jgi:ABC-type nickel/cobalt efflux system permease component RcnA